MKLWDILATANRNLTRSKLRTLLTISAIFVGGFTLTLTTALNTGASEYLNRQLGNVSVPGVFEVVPKTELNPLQSGVSEYDPDKKQANFADILNSTFTHDYVKKLAAVDGVAKAEPLYNAGIEYITRADGSSKKYTVIQIAQDIGLDLDLAAGRLVQDGDTSAIVLPEDYIEKLGFTSSEDAIGKKVAVAYKNTASPDLETLDLTIVGVMRKTFVTSGQLFVNFDSMRTIAEAQGQANRFFGGLVVFKDVNDSTDESVLKARLEAAGEFTAVSVKERISTVITIVGAITAALNVVGIIALIAASFGIINTLLMSVYERTREIGLMKAVGMHRRTVFALFAVEAALVGFWGSAIAVLVAWLVSIAVNDFASSTFLKDFEGFTLLVVNPTGAIFVVAIIMAIAFLAGTLPAIKASRLDPIEALRSE